MLKKKNRLRKTKEIEGVFKEGKSFYDSNFTLKILKNSLEINRLCVVISAKVSKKSVHRNKLKRRVKAIFYAKQRELNKGFDFLLITKKNTDNHDFELIKKSMNELFIRAKINNQ